LFLVRDVLVLTTPTLAEVSASRLNTRRSSSTHFHQSTSGKLPFDLGQLNLHFLTLNHERHKHHKIPNPPNALPAKCHVMDPYHVPIANPKSGCISGAFAMNHRSVLVINQTTRLPPFCCVARGGLLFKAGNACPFAAITKLPSPPN
jgi:hypothetical protein